MEELAGAFLWYIYNIILYILGASLSELHLDELAGAFLWYIS